LRREDRPLLVISTAVGSLIDMTLVVTARPQIYLFAAETAGESPVRRPMDLCCLKGRAAPLAGENDADNWRGLICMHRTTSAQQGSFRLPCGLFCKRNFRSTAHHMRRNRARCSNLRLVSLQSFRFTSTAGLAGDMPLPHPLSGPRRIVLPDSSGGGSLHVIHAT
jgi:hypothetical protein